MIRYKDNIIEKINSWPDNSVHILADFDRTITMDESKTTWGILSDDNLSLEEYVTERNRLYDFYRPIELNEALDYEDKNKYMVEWWTKHINLFINFGLKEETIKKAVKDSQTLKFRDGAIDFFKGLKNKNIPLIIISAGIGNVIEEFLRNNNCYFDNIYIVANFIEFKDGVAIGIRDEIIHSLNKNEAILPDFLKDIIKDRPNIILLGDQISDTRMIPNEVLTAIKIGFCEENVVDNLRYFIKNYDVICTDKTTFKDLAKDIKIFKE